MKYPEHQVGKYDQKVNQVGVSVLQVTRSGGVSRETTPAMKLT